MKHAPKWRFRGMLCKSGAHLARFMVLLMLNSGNVEYLFCFHEEWCTIQFLHQKMKGFSISVHIFFVLKSIFID